MTIDDIALQLTYGIGVRAVRHLVDTFGSAGAVFGASAEELELRAGLRPQAVKSLLSRKSFADAEREMEYCHRNGIRILAMGDDEYPALLREVPDNPHVIYVQGDVTALSGHAVAMVGTREATPYGQTMCARLVEGLAGRVPGLVVVSGLAFGIDVAAHRAALAGDVPTVAVLANALPGVTPAQHANVAREIVEKGGALVTELHSGAKQKGNFYLQRNRIIAALGAGTIVVESPNGGGSLVTANYADGYNRTVMAVPGRVTDKTSAGTNLLIRNRKAQLVLSADDVIEALMWDLGEDPAMMRPKPATPQLTPDEEGLLGCFRTTDPLTMEELEELTGLNPGELATLLIGLELSGAVRQLPGNRYMKL